MTVSTANAPGPSAPGRYSATSRSDLDESLGYERYVLWECGDAVRCHSGKSSIRIVMTDSGPPALHISVEDVIGETGASMVKKMSPLIFTASHKLLDMIFEWILRENELTCPFRFAQKIAIIDQTATLQYPDFLAGDAALRSTLVALYKGLTPYRNAITHHVWGRVAEGQLDFDFVRDGRHFQTTMSFEALLDLAEYAELLGRMLVNQQSDQHQLDTLRWLLDRLATFHGQALFHIGKPRYFEVIRRTNLPTDGPPSVDLAAIRHRIDQQAMGSPASFDLIVFADAAPQPAVWRIPFAEIPSGATLTLDNCWDRFRLGEQSVQPIAKLVG